MNLLLTFYNNQAEREAVKAFMIDTLKEIAVDRAFSGQDVYGMQQAKECIDRAFDKLEETYGKIESPVITNSK